MEPGVAGVSAFPVLGQAGGAEGVSGGGFAAPLAVALAHSPQPIAHMLVRNFGKFVTDAAPHTLGPSHCGRFVYCNHYIVTIHKSLRRKRLTVFWWYVPRGTWKPMLPWPRARNPARLQRPPRPKRSSRLNYRQLPPMP